MIDKDGFRPNVGIMIANAKGDLLWAKRVGQSSWQFPQGGINDGESTEEAMYRELYEEIGLRPEAVEIIANTRGWLRYRLPERMIRKDSTPTCIGQKQKWFLLNLIEDENNINVLNNDKPEFDYWRWVSYWYPLGQVVSFKRDVYRRALKELSAKHARLLQR